MEAFRRSHAVAIREPQVYVQMARAASTRMEAFSSLKTVAGALEAFIGDVLDTDRSVRAPARVAGGMAE